jgi:hypothetical protein
MSELVRHARHELELIGEESETIEGYCRVIQAFADMGHSGGSASAMIPTLNALLQFKNLRPITNDPREWIHISGEIWGGKESEGIWQSNRNPEIFSTDTGKTHYILSERPRVIHTSTDCNTASNQTNKKGK